MPHCLERNQCLRVECPVSGRGTLSEEFVEELGKHLDNCKLFPANWKGLACNLLKCRTCDIEYFEGRASRDWTGRRSPTWEVYQKFIQSNGDQIDIAAFWNILYHNMKRRDVARELVSWYQSNRLFKQFRHDQPPRASLPNSLSLTTAPPEEPCSINSVDPNVLANSQAREVDTLRVTANTVIITTAPGQQLLTNTPPSTETSSLNVTGSSSTSSLHGDQELSESLREIVLHDDTSSEVPIGPVPASSCSTGIVGNIHELITDETKSNTEVKEIEITWVAKQVARNDRLYSKRQSLFRHLKIPDHQIRKIRLERLDRVQVNIEDEIFKVINIGWLQKQKTKTRNFFIKHLFTFDGSLAQEYAKYINGCDDFDIGLPLTLPSSMDSNTSPATPPAIQGPGHFSSLQSVTDTTTLVARGLSVQETIRVDGSQFQFNSLPNTLSMLSADDVSEQEITWLSEKVASGPHASERNSLYRHLSIADLEVERIKYEQLGDDRRIENEIFKVINEGWCSQGANRSRALLSRQLWTFDQSLADDYVKNAIDNKWSL